MDHTRTVRDIQMQFLDDNTFVVSAIENASQSLDPIGKLG